MDKFMIYTEDSVFEILADEISNVFVLGLLDQHQQRRIR